MNSSKERVKKSQSKLRISMQLNYTKDAFHWDRKHCYQKKFWRKDLELNISNITFIMPFKHSIGNIKSAARFHNVEWGVLRWLID